VSPAGPALTITTRPAARLARRGTGAAVLAALVLVALPGGADAASKVAACRTQTATVTAGQTVKLALDCRVASKGAVKRIAVGRTGKAVRSVTTLPRNGRLSGVNARTGAATYRPNASFSGTDTVRYRLRLPSGKRYTGLVRMTVRPRATVPAPPAPPVVVPPADPAADPPVTTTTPTTPTTPVDPPPVTSEIPAELPLAPLSVAAGTRAWSPTVRDTCPKSLHDRFAVIGPDGKRYPTWHPATVVDPATGQRCTFGHEHGRDPHQSNLFRWVADHLSTTGREEFAGVPFGLATEALDQWRVENPTPARAEDNPGYKVDFRNDVRLVAQDGQDLGVTCDYLVRVHQGSHSADAASNNVHDLLYAVRCSDGTQLISDTVARFGDPGKYQRACDPLTQVTTTDNGYPGGPGSRLIPDRTCVETTFLVPTGRTTSAYALWEKWTADNSLHHGDAGTAIADFDTGFAVYDPARYAATGGLGRSLTACWETLPNGNHANGVACDEATAGGTISVAYAYDDPRSPFNGTDRETYLGGTTLRNGGGPTRWYTDPYGGHASTTPFPGAVCQLVGAVDTSSRPVLREQKYRHDSQATGVHAPN